MKLQKVLSFMILLILWTQMLFQSYFAYWLVPWDITNWVFHFDAQNLDADDNFSTQPIDNSRISELLDLAKSNTWTQIDINKQAEFQVSWLNNKPALFFDGIDDIYTLNDHVDIGSWDQYIEKSFAIVFQTSWDINSLQTLYEQGWKERGYALQIDSGKLYVWAWNTIDWPVWEQFKIADLWDINQNTTYNVMISQESSIWNNLAVYIDGSLVNNILTVSEQTVHGTCIISWAFSCYLFQNGGSIGLGATKNDTLQLSSQTELTVDEAHHFEWYIGEIMSWNNALTQTDVSGLFIYFDDKWALKGSEITFENPGLTWVIQPWNFDIYITYNDFQNWNWIDISSDDIKLYTLDGLIESWDVTNTYIFDAWKSISQFEAFYPIIWIPNWKYRIEFSINKTNGLTSTQTRDFYVGQLLPIDVLEPVFHYDAQDINGDWDLWNNPVDWSSIQTLTDKFNWYDAFQNTVANRPTLMNNSINTHPAINFNGSNQFFDINNQIEINSSSYTEKSFAAVFQTGNDINTFQTIYEQGWGLRWYSFVIDGGSIYAGIWNNTEWDVWHQYKSVNLWPAQANTTYFSMIVQDSQTNDDDLNTLKIYLNGNLTSVQTHTDAQNSHTGNISLWRVNGQSVSASNNAVVNEGNHFNGKIWEFISWNHAFDQADVNGIQEYFSNRWWIVLFSETYSIPSPTSDTTPAYTFTTNRSGTLTFIGSCSSATTNVTIWENTINLSTDISANPLQDWDYNDCVIELLDDFWNTHVLNITPFRIEASIHTLTEIQAIATNTSDHFPSYIFSSPIEWTIEYIGDCSSNTTYANIWENTIILNYLADGDYDNCYLRVVNNIDTSEYLLFSSFTIWSSAPVFVNSSIESDDVFATGNFILSIDYFDNAWINASSSNIILQKYDPLLWDWASDISNTFLSEISNTTTNTQYISNISAFWKYRIQFSIENIHGTSSTLERIFYVDAPEFIIDRWDIDLWNLVEGITNFSTPIEIQVLTVWAEFNMLLKKENLLEYNWNVIQDFDWNTWYGYQDSTYTWPLQVISDVETIGSQSKNVSITWERNTYIYHIRLWALIDNLQSAWDYRWNIQFGIQLQYD